MDFSIADLTSSTVVIAALALLVRATAALVSAIGKALDERSTASRLKAQAELVEAEHDAETDTELRGDLKSLRAIVDQLRADLSQQHLECQRELGEAHYAHAQTLDQMVQLRADTDRQLAAMRQEFERQLDAAMSGHSR